MTPLPPTPPLLPAPLALPPSPPFIVTVTFALPLPPAIFCEMLCCCAVPPLPPFPALPSPPAPPVVVSVVASEPLLVVALAAVITAFPPPVPVAPLVPFAPVKFTDCETAPAPLAVTLPVTVMPVLLTPAAAVPNALVPPAAFDDAVPPPLLDSRPSFDDAKALSLPPVAPVPPVALVWTSSVLGVEEMAVVLARALPPLPATVPV